MILYTIISHILSLLALPFFLLKMLLTGKYRRGLAQRFGFFPPNIPVSLSGCPRIWAHAVSVGEVIALSPVVTELKRVFPASSIVISTTTETGQEMAKQEISEADVYIYFPLDLLLIVKKVISLIKPDLFITCESELWPCFLHRVKKCGAKTMLVNGRISESSTRHYRRLKPLFQKVLADFDYIGMSSDRDRRRIESIGGNSKKINVTGNSKYDKLIDQIKPSYEGEMRRLLKIGSDETVFIAASTHRGEEAIIFQTYKTLREHFPQLFLIVIPRHRERGYEVKRLAEKMGLGACILRSRLGQEKERTVERVIVMDSIGELFKTYSLGTIIFCGGSLVPKGGQNILEAAAWGKTVLYGPSMEDFVDARQTLEEVGAGFTIKGLPDLVEKGLYLLKNREEREKLGNLAKDAILNKTGAAIDYAHNAEALLK